MTKGKYGMTNYTESKSCSVSIKYLVLIPDIDVSWSLTKKTLLGIFLPNSIFKFRPGKWSLGSSNSIVIQKLNG